MATGKLTPKQAAFVRWYTTPGDTMYNATRSAERAGYSGGISTLARQGHDNTRNPKVQREINRVLQSSFTQADLTVESVIAKLEQHRLLAIMWHDLSGANKALEMQGKYLKMFADRVEHVHSVEDASEDELLALLTELIGKQDGLDVTGILAVLGGGGSPSSGGAHTPGAPTTH